MSAYGDSADLRGDEPPSEPTPQRRALAFHVIIRTRYFDDCLLAAADAGCRQVVLVAAGLDTRAFRLDWPPGTTVYELDLPDLLEVKERVLSDTGATPTCERVVVPADLTEDWLPALTGRGFDPDVATAWLVEGLLVYLTPADAEGVLATLTAASAPGSRLTFERGSAAAAVTAADTAHVTSLWQGGVDDPLGWLAARGWHTDFDNLADVADRYGRAPLRRTASGFVQAVRT